MKVKQMANYKFTVVGMNIAEKATMIWSVADMLRGSFKPHDYNYITRLPGCSIRICTRNICS